MRWFVFLLLAGCLAPIEAPVAVEAPQRTGRAPDLDGLDQRIAEAANDARRRQGVDPLAWRADLASIARRHSRDMGRRGYFDHVSPDGQTPQDRARAGEIVCEIPLPGRTRVGVAENLFLTSRYRRYSERTAGGRVTRTYDWFDRAELADRTVDGWLDSPSHRRNLLDPVARAQGIGVAVGTDDRVYITQVLC
ncbi:CAP domain-containing protein [Rubrivirga sp. IMCC43871]|uniref:CAP domain-containing protein n=1 Tax=Rubrivirga sp. IMCC43871 TaxID=3391575 RepID=UPI00398F9F00